MVKRFLFIIIFIFLILIIVLFVTYNSKNFDSITSNSLVSKFYTNQREYVFFDLGANDGDSLLEFFDIKSQGYLIFIITFA